MRTGYKNLITIGSDGYDIGSEDGEVRISIKSEIGLDESMVRFNIRGSDIFIEFTDDGVVRLEEVGIKFRARLVRERLMKVSIGKKEAILATMTMF